MRFAPGAGNAPEWKSWPALPEKTEVILGGMIANVQLKNVQKSRSGLTRMAKFAFEDLTGSSTAMLWPEEFAPLRGDLLHNDLIGFVRGTLNRSRDPAELVVSRRSSRLTRARPGLDTRGNHHASQGNRPDRIKHQKIALPQVRAHPPGNPRRLSRNPRPSPGCGRRCPRPPLRYDSPRRPARWPISKRPSARATSACSASDNDSSRSSCPCRHACLWPVRSRPRR